MGGCPEVIIKDIGGNGNLIVVYIEEDNEIVSAEYILVDFPDLLDVLFRTPLEKRVCNAKKRVLVDYKEKIKKRCEVKKAIKKCEQYE